MPSELIKLDALPNSSDYIVGTHVIVDLIGISAVNFKKLKQLEYLLFDELVTESLIKNGMKILNKHVNHFNDIGSFTSLYLLSESHLSIHTWFEYGYISLVMYCATGLFMCNKVTEIVATCKNKNSNIYNLPERILSFSANFLGLMKAYYQII